MVIQQHSCHPSVPSICGYTLTSVGAARPLCYPWIHQHMAVASKGQKMHISSLCWCLCLSILRFVIPDAYPAPDSMFLWWLWYPKQENKLTFSAAFASASQRAPFHRAACWVGRELACSQKHCHIPTSFSLKVLFIKKAHTWGRRSIFAALLSQAPADPSVPASRMFATLHLLQLLLASPNPDSQELPSAVTCYFLFFVDNKPWEHNVFFKNDVTTFKKIACGEVFSISFTKISCCLQKMTKRINLVHLIAAQRGQALRSRVNQTCTALSAWKVRFIPSPAPLGVVSVACAAVPWRCLCEILGSAHARGAGALGCSPEQADPKAWPSCTAAQPLILLNPCSLGLPLLSFFSPPHSYSLFLPSPQLPSFSLHSALPRVHTNKKHFLSQGGKPFCSSCVLGKIHQHLPLSVEPKCPKEVPFFWLPVAQLRLCSCWTWRSRNDCQCIISECNYIIIYPLKEYNPPLTTYTRNDMK